MPYRFFIGIFQPIFIPRGDKKSLAIIYNGILSLYLQLFVVVTAFIGFQPLYILPNAVEGFIPFSLLHSVTVFVTPFIVIGSTFSNLYNSASSGV